MFPHGELSTPLSFTTHHVTSYDTDYTILCDPNTGLSCPCLRFRCLPNQPSFPKSLSKFIVTIFFPSLSLFHVQKVETTDKCWSNNHRSLFFIYAGRGYYHNPIFDLHSYFIEISSQQPP